jgi:hypothetical protein
MPHIVFIGLAAVAVLMFKHAVADFYLQSTYEYVNKGTTAILERHPRREAARISRDRTHPSSLA